MEAPLTYARVDRDLLTTLRAPGRLYYALLAVDLAVLGWAIYAWRYQLTTGLGVAGITHPVMWAVYITNFVFWVGIAHSGTLISAILYLFRVRWRPPVYRSAEAVTVFALMTAGLFPIIHLGRPWYFYWLLPYPQMGGLWINFRSPLIWDVFAVLTYMTVSVIFFFTGLVPDVAVARDQATGWRRRIYGLLAQGWQGTDRQWRHYTSAYLLFAGLATALVVSVHSVVSWDFAMAILPGWHSTIFAPYFVAGAIHSGLAMVLALLIPLRRAFRLEAYLTPDHLERLAQLTIVTGLIVGYAYMVEYGMAWYTGDPAEQASFLWRATGHYAWAFWLMVGCNVLAPLGFCARQVRRSMPWLLGILANHGREAARTAARHPDPQRLAVRTPESPAVSAADAWFFLWFLLFAKTLPVVSLWEVKELLPVPRRDGRGPVQEGPAGRQP
ncbi:MAG: polysulfide reductase NrfD [Deltaproteobacteria bacterium]|nr:polysulfide reductase NrfD [Deltaproteobacteria bacterium]